MRTPVRIKRSQKPQITGFLMLRLGFINAVQVSIFMVLANVVPDS